MIMAIAKYSQVFILNSTEKEVNSIVPSKLYKTNKVCSVIILKFRINRAFRKPLGVTNSHDVEFWQAWTC